MQVINNEPHAVLATFDRKIEVLIPPGCTAEMPSATRADVRLILDTGEQRDGHEHSHRSLYSTLRDEPLPYKLDDDLGDAR